MRTALKTNFKILYGAFLIALSLNFFLAPANLAPGGISGLAVILHHLASIPMGITFLALNIPLFLYSLKYFSRSFTFSSLWGMTTLSLLAEVLGTATPITHSPLLAIPFGGGIMGLGVGIVLSAGSSTGGTEMGAHILKQQFPAISMGKLILIIDVAITILAGITFGKWETTLYSAAALFVCSVVVDLMIKYQPL